MTPLLAAASFNPANDQRRDVRAIVPEWFRERLCSGCDPATTDGAAADAIQGRRNYDVSSRIPQTTPITQKDRPGKWMLTRSRQATPTEINRL